MLKLMDKKISTISRPKFCFSGGMGSEARLSFGYHVLSTGAAYGNNLHPYLSTVNEQSYDIFALFCPPLSHSISARAQLCSKAWCMKFYLALHQHAYFTRAKSGCSGETPRMRSLAWAFAVRHWSENHFHMNMLKYCYLHNVLINCISALIVMK